MLIFRNTRGELVRGTSGSEAQDLELVKNQKQVRDLIVDSKDIASPIFAVISGGKK